MMMVTALILALLIVTGVSGQPVLLLVLGLESERKAPVSEMSLEMQEWNVRKTRRSSVRAMFPAPLTASRFGLTGQVVIVRRVKGRGRGSVLRRKMRQRTVSVRPKRDPQGRWGQWW